MVHGVSVQELIDKLNKHKDPSWIRFISFIHCTIIVWWIIFLL